MSERAVALVCECGEDIPLVFEETFGTFNMYHRGTIVAYLRFNDTSDTLSLAKKLVTTIEASFVRDPALWKCSLPQSLLDWSKS